jgi:hypothetical protein
MHNPSKWDDKALVHLRYHAKQLLRTRKNAINRFQLWLRTYVILRDARAKGFVDVKLLGQLMTRPAHTVTKLPTTASQKWDCAHCHTKGLHEGLDKRLAPPKTYKPASPENLDDRRSNPMEITPKPFLKWYQHTPRSDQCVTTISNRQCLYIFFDGTHT